MFKCPCSEGKVHLGISPLKEETKWKPQLMTLTKMSLQRKKLNKKFFSCNGIIGSQNETEAADLLLHRDHEDIAELNVDFQPGKLGAKFVPPVFFSELKKSLEIRHHDRIRGEIPEKFMFETLKHYFQQLNDDVLVLRSHKFISSDYASPNEKDFIVLNLSKGYVMLFEVKANVRKYQKSIKQLFDGKLKIEQMFRAVKCSESWQYVGVFYAQNSHVKCMFDCEQCNIFAILGNTDSDITGKLKTIEQVVSEQHLQAWKPAEHVQEFIELSKQLMFISQGDPSAPVTNKLF